MLAKHRQPHSEHARDRIELISPDYHLNASRAPSQRQATTEACACNHKTTDLRNHEQVIRKLKKSTAPDNMGLKRSVQIPFFRIWYSSFFVILFLITFVLTLVSPADLIYQAAKDNRNIANIISVAAVYFAAAVLCFFIWASRIYTNRAVLRDIPKHYLPIDAGEVPRKVRRLIEKQWKRSALVAWDSRPRDVSLELKAEDTIAVPTTGGKTTGPAVPTTTTAHEQEYGTNDNTADASTSRHHERRFRRRERTKDATTVSANTVLKAWGRITHPGWSVPDAASGQPESVQYSTVIIELPNLLEAKAVSLAPTTSRPPASAGASSNDLPNHERDEVLLPPDARVVAVLQRPPQTGLRSYINHLVALGIVAVPEDAEDFLTQYEYARFSTTPLTEAQFESLMTAFATLLSGMLLDLDRITPLLLDLNDDDDNDDGSISSSSSSSSSYRASLETRSVSTSSNLVTRRRNTFRPDDGASAYSLSSSISPSDHNMHSRTVRLSQTPSAAAAATSAATAAAVPNSNSNFASASRAASASVSSSSINGSVGSVIIKPAAHVT